MSAPIKKQQPHARRNENSATQALNGHMDHQNDDGDRPDSSKVIELHIYILPRDVWITKQKLAYNETIREAISSGFVRVVGELLLHDLRAQIKKQCNPDDVPPDYVFLRSVGRALTRVKPHQEFELKARYFLPPMNHGPEVFLLEFDKNKDAQLMKKFDGVGNKHDDFYYDPNLDKMRDYEKMREEQERLKQRQADLERLRQMQQDQLNSMRHNNNKNGGDMMTQWTNGDYNNHDGGLGTSRSRRGGGDDDIDEFAGYRHPNETIASLKEKLNNTRDKREELERLREDLIKHLKQIHNRISVRRKEARDLWKKKYFNEKKKTPPLEERMNALIGEIQQSQEKMFHSLENEVRNAASIGYNRESEVKTNWLTSLRLQEDIYLLRRQLDQQKLKLTTDIKLRNQAESESKALRTELAQTKMNLNQLKQAQQTTN